MHRKLDRIPEFDERSRLFRAVDLITDYTLRSYTWSCSVFNDQGYEGACVGFSWSHELAARPKVFLTDNAFARQIYYRARVLDQWPGEDYEGTSVLAGAKAVAERKGTNGLPLIGGYRWAFGIEETVRVIGRRGPVVLGVNWYDGMFNTNAGGYIAPEGEVAGGHAIMANGVRLYWKDPLSTDRTFSNLDVNRSYVKLHNSWGPDWGYNGGAKITVANLDRLLREDGEACIPLKRSV